MASIFTKIINGEIPCYKVAETDDFLAFLDIRPLAKGHTLCIPKKEVDYIFELDDETYSGLNLFTKKVAKALETNIECKRVGVLVIGTEVPHAHIHLIPFKQEVQMSILSPKVEITSKEMADLAAEVKATFDKNSK